MQTVRIIYCFIILCKVSLLFTALNAISCVHVHSYVYVDGHDTMSYRVLVVPHEHPLQVRHAVRWTVVPAWWIAYKALHNTDTVDIKHQIIRILFPDSLLFLVM